MTQKKFFFLTTSQKNLYFLSANISKKYLEKKNKQSYELKLVNKKKFYFLFLKFFLREFVCGNLSDKKKIVKIKYNNFSIGRYVLSSYIRKSLYYNSLFKKYLFLKLLFQGINIINTYKTIDKNIVGIYVDHAQFINGLYVEIFSKFKKNVSIYNYPRGLTLTDFSKAKNKKKGSFDGILQLDFKKKKMMNYEKKMAKNKINQSLKNPKIIPWLGNTNFFQFKKHSFKNFSHVIYAHSFTDDQLMWGYDEFIDMREWLNFTIEELIKNKKYFIIKSHPNFFTNSNDKLKREYLDKQIFHEIKKKYKSRYIKFIDYPLKNKLFLENLNKKSILISHHGTAIFEGIFKNFKVISSKSTLWNKNFKLTNNWSNQKQYRQLLRKNWNNLSYANYDDFYKICYSLYCNKYNIYGKYFWQKNLLNNLNLKLYENDKKVSLKINKLINSNRLENITNNTINTIEDLN